MKTILSVLALGILVAGCASTSVIPVSTTATATPALAQSQEIQIFLSEADVKAPFTVIATIQHNNPGKYQRLDLESETPTLKEKARAVGANGIIVDKKDPIYSGIFSRGIDITARAIKF